MAWRGIHCMPFGDEAEQMLGSRMLDGGGRLYASYVDSHGPLTFMAGQVYGAVFGWADPNAARWLIVALAGVAAVTVAWLPRAGAAGRGWTLALFLGVMRQIWLVQGLYLVNYYVVTGAVAAVAVAMAVGGQWARRDRGGRQGWGWRRHCWCSGRIRIGGMRPSGICRV